MDAVSAGALFRRILGEGFDALPAQLRALHGIVPGQRVTWRGEAAIARGRNPLARLCALATRLPRANECAPTTIEFAADADGETWRRDFAGAPMVSRYRQCDGLLCERLGLVEFAFALRIDAGEIRWTTAGVRLFGALPLPAAWFAGVRCRERERNGRYEFLVEATLPLAGPLVRYEGWLERA
ncbi:DUF4166 domain-containing protein [Pseudoluteimonas lycopersici]|uniref:DUF4166 domain-containing protein n=1 Tax=Pseudoluteimonas lycopersici TaxID=1324796 RepID=A0A516V7U0_9GAMM|nr:DUF4166 domain-containing protein [Lysobacter lycopersici]QDQ74534.1 DUF4166 domain-containing protein [Lysobacter lycopersici]